MEIEQHIGLMKDLIQQNEKSLAEMQNILSQVERCRTDSIDRQRQVVKGNDEQVTQPVS